MEDRPKNSMLSTSDPMAALRWNSLLELQVSAYLPYELSFYLGWPGWASRSRILDAGCGNGYFLSWLKRFFPEKAYTGLDLSAELVAAARDNRDLTDVEIVHNNFFAYSPVAKFDAVIMRLIVQHMAGFEQIFDKLNDLVNAGGSVIIVEPEPRLFLNHPRTPLFERLLGGYAKHAAQSGLNRASLAVLAEELAKIEGWVIEQDKTFLAPSVGPFETSGILQIYTHWINLFRQVPGLDRAFDEAQSELEAWARSDRTFSQVGIRMIEVRRCSP